MHSYHIKFTKNQQRRLKEKAETLGFLRISDYMRFVLFMELSVIEKLHDIHEEVTLLQKVRKRTRSKTISISLDLWENVEKICAGKVSVSSFIRMAVIKELQARGVVLDE
jgi:hypothetical protein